MFRACLASAFESFSALLLATSVETPDQTLDSAIIIEGIPQEKLLVPSKGSTGVL